MTEVGRDAVASLGSDVSCEIRVQDPYVSPRHCTVIRKQDGRLFVADLGSAHGTWLELAGLSFWAKVRTPQWWPSGWTLWLGRHGRQGLELGARGWVRVISR